MNLGKSLKQAMLNADMKGKDLAELLDVPESSVSRWRKEGNMKHNNLLEVCKAFNMSVSDFIKLGEEAA